MTKHPGIPLLAIAMLSVGMIAAVSLDDQGIRFPDGTYLTTAHNDGFIFIPVGSLLLDGNASATDGTRVHLGASGNSIISASLVVPGDHKPFSLIYVDLLVHNPLSNGACQAEIRTNFGRRFRPELTTDLSGVFGYATAFPPYPAGDYTMVHEYRFTGNAEAGDAITFGWFRAGDDSSDNCGVVEVVGVNIRYERN